MSIGVRYDISDRVVIQQFHRAFDFWAKLLDADFHDDRSTSCAIAIVEASDALLQHVGTICRPSAVSGQVELPRMGRG